MSPRFDPAPPPAAGLPPGASASAWPLAWMGLGLLWLLVAAGWLVAQPDLLTLPHFHPATVGWVHLWLPGGLLAICIGACYQLMPVVLGPPLRTPRGGMAAHLTLHTVGITALTLAFASGRYAHAGLAGLPVTVGTLLLFTTALRTWWFSTRRDVVAWCLPLSTGWLVLTTLSGVLLACNRAHGFLSGDILLFLRAHAHVGLAGFFLTLLQGMTFQLIPMFTMAELRGRRALPTGFWLTQIALPLLITGWVVGTGALIVVASALLTAGVGASAAALVLTLRSRRRRQLERPVRVFLIGGVLGALTMGGGVALAVWPLPADLALRSALAYGVLLIPGALSLMILGMTGKILPFLIWLRAYGPHLGQRPVPLATKLGWPRLEAVGGGLLLTASLGLGTAALTQAPALARIAAGVLAAAILALALNAGRMAWHLVPKRPRG
jgi:hypothetical protein